jgi:hypothetical protein
MPIGTRTAPSAAGDIEQPPSSWKDFLDVDGDGYISRGDLTECLFLVGASLSLTEFEELLARVQTEPDVFAGFVFSGDTPSQLKLALDNEEMDYLEGAWPQYIFFPVLIASYCLFFPMLNIRWPIPLFSTKSIRDRAVANNMLWRAGLSFQVACWFLWMPSAVLFVAYRPPSIHLADILNPLVLYWSFIGVLFVVWVGAGRTDKGMAKQLRMQKAIYGLNYLRLVDPSDNLKVDNGLAYLQKVMKDPDLLEISLDVTTVNIDDRFTTWLTSRGRRRESAAEFTSLQEETQKITDPYQNRTPKRAWFAMGSATALPFVSRAVDGRSVFGESAPAVVINVLMSALTLWCWWALCVIIVKRQSELNYKVTRINDLFLENTLKWRLDEVERRGTKKSDPSRAVGRKKGDEGIAIDLSVSSNINGVLAIYRTLAMYETVKSSDAKNYFTAGLLLLQVAFATTLVTISLLRIEIPVVVLGYVLLETALALWLLADNLLGCASANDGDRKMGKLCSSINYELLMLEEMTESDKVEARKFKTIADMLENQNIRTSNILGVRVTKAMAMRIVGTLAAATISAVIRGGIT